MRNSISRWQIPSRRKWNVKLTCCSSFPWFAQFSIVLSSSFDRILYRLPYRTIRTTAWMLYSGVSGVAKVREFGHIINLCVYRHYDVGHTACIWGDQTHEYIQRGSRCVSVCVCGFFTLTLPLSSAWSSSFVDFQMRAANGDNIFRFRSMYRKHQFNIHIPHFKPCSRPAPAQQMLRNEKRVMMTLRWVKMSWHLCKYMRRTS